MNRLVALCCFLAPSIAVAAPRIDVFDASLNHVRTIDPQGGGSQLIRDLELGPDGHLWVLLTDSSHGRNQCNPNDMIKRFDANGDWVADYKAGLRYQQGFAINPEGGYWVTAIPGCGALGGGRVYRVDASDNVVASGPNYTNGLGEIDLLPNGRLVTGSWYNLMTVDANSASTLSSAARSSYYARQFSYDPVSGNIIVPAPRNGPGDDFLHQFSTTGSFVSGSNITQLGVEYPRAAVAMSDGRVVLFENASNNQTTAHVLPPSHSTITESVPLTLSRQSMWTAVRDADDNLYVASWGPEPIEGLSLSLSDPSVGAPSSLDVTFVAPLDIEPSAYLEVTLDIGLDVSQLQASDAEIVAGLDGTIVYSPDEWFWEGSQDIRVGFHRTGGSTIPAGTEIALRLNGLVNPDAPTDIAVRRVDLREDLWGNTTAVANVDMPSLSIVDQLECVVGELVDADGDGTSDYCMGPLAEVAPNAVIGSRAQIGNVYVGPGAVIGAGAMVGDGAVVAPRAQVGPDSTLGEGVVIGRGVRIGAGSTLAAGVVVSRQARVGANSFLPEGSVLSYGAQLGMNAVFGDRLVLGPFATLGGELAEPGAIDCAGELIIGRDAKVAADAPHALRCMGSAIIGPEVEVRSGAGLGDRTRLRKGGVMMPGLTTGTNTRVGRDVAFGHSVTLMDDTVVRGDVELCDNAVESGVVPRHYVDPGCTAP